MTDVNLEDKYDFKFGQSEEKKKKINEIVNPVIA